MLKRRIFLLFIFISSLLYAEPYITLKKFWYEPDVNQSGIYGFKMYVVAKRSLSNETDEASLLFNLIDNGRFLFERRTTIKSDTISAFIPYYMVDIGSGFQEVSVELDPRYISKQDKAEYFMTYIGRVDYTIQLNLPRIYKLKLKIDSLRIVETVDWENEGMPDLMYRLFYSTNKHIYNRIYQSEVIIDSLSASWQDYSSTIYVSEKDLFSVYIEDADNEFDREISHFVFTYQSFIETAANKISPGNDGIDYISFSFVEMN